MKRKTTDYYYKLKRDERIKFLESSIHWLRGEALSLSDTLDEVKIQNKELKTRIEQGEREREFLLGLTRTTKRQNFMLKRTIEQLKDPENLRKYALAQASVDADHHI